jgi:hypothetical protein
MTVFLVACDAVEGTQEVIADTEAEALIVARQYLGQYDWRIHSTIVETPFTAPVYQRDPWHGRDPLEGED